MSYKRGELNNNPWPFNMKNTKITAVLMILIVAGLVLMPGCGKKTSVKYIVPTGYTILEAKGNQGTAQTGQGQQHDQQGSQPVTIVIKDKDDTNSTTVNTADDKDNKTSLPVQSGYSTVVQPTSSVIGSYTPYEYDVNSLKPRLCSINEVILGYVGCYYNKDFAEAKVTLKDTGRGDIEQIWFYLVFADKTVFLKSEGFTVGNINDYQLLLSEWSTKYNGKIQRILITPVIKEGNFLFICNNRQLLLIHENSCRETAD